MLIYVDAPSGRRTGVRLRPNDTVGDLKVRIEDEEWIPKDRQCLTYHNDELEDGHTFEFYGVRKGETIFLSQIYAAFPINIRVSTGGTIRILVEGINTIASLNSRLHEMFPRDMLQLIFKGQRLEDKKLIFDYNIQRESTVDLKRTGHNIVLNNYYASLFAYRRASRPVSVFTAIKQKKKERKNLQSLGLVGIAQAISLWDWDGVIPGMGKKYAAGLRLSKGDVVTVGRIVNDEWFQGCNKGFCGYFPRAFVSIRKIENSYSKDDIRVDDTPVEELQVNGGSSAKAPPNAILKFLQRLSGVISGLFASESKPLAPPPNFNRPVLPPSPIPAPPAFDRIVKGNRVLVQFSLDPKDNERNCYTLRATLSLNSAPGVRFSGLTFEVNLPDGTILAISPENVVGPETEAEVTKDKNFQASLSTSLQAGSAPISASIGASATLTSAEHITFVRKTRGTVQGNGVRSSTAYWVMKGDSGPAAEQGLGPVFDLMIKLNVRPAIISFEFVAYILWESGKRKTIQSRILDTSV